jgi:hypothetical protein
MIVPLTRPASEFQLTRSCILKVFDTVVRSGAAKELQRASCGMYIYLSGYEDQSLHSLSVPEIAVSFDKSALLFPASGAFNSDADWSSVFAAWRDATSIFFTIGQTGTIVEFVDLARESSVGLRTSSRSYPVARVRNDTPLGCR